MWVVEVWLSERMQDWRGYLDDRCFLKLERNQSRLLSPLNLCWC